MIGIMMSSVPTGHSRAWRPLQMLFLYLELFPLSFAWITYTVL